MSLLVHTARVTKNPPPDALDVSRMSGKEGLFLAPSWKILKPALAGRKEAKAWAETGNDFVGLAIECAWWDLYVPQYIEEMRASYARQRERWEELLRRERVILLCYCPGRTHCHRGILAETILPKLGATDGGEL